MRSSEALLALGLLSLAAPGAAQATRGDADGDVDAAEPPEDMIDFLGRRRECTSITPEPGESRPPPPPDSWSAWLRCEDLQREEAALRRLHAGDLAAIAFLDRPPETFKLDRLVVRGYDGPPYGLVERVAQEGLDPVRRVPWRAVLDRRARKARATSVSVSWGAHPPRTIYLDNERLAGIDLATLSVALKPEPPYEGLLLELRYGYGRGWCGALEEDDRGRIFLRFAPDLVTGRYEDMTNCGGDSHDLELGGE
jgi:hypothetical protein